MSDEHPTNVLVVDDEPDMITYLSAWLQDEGYGVFCARNGTEGIAIMNRERVDLVLMDVKMPHQSGLQLYREMHNDEALKGIPVIFVSGMTQYQLFDEECASLPEPAARITKPVDLPALSTALERALASG